MLANRLCDLLPYLAEKDDALMAEVSVGDDCREKDLYGGVAGIELELVIASIFEEPSAETLDVCPFAVNSLSEVGISVFLYSHLLCLGMADSLTAVGLHEGGAALGTTVGSALWGEKSDNHDMHRVLNHLMLLVDSCFLANLGHRHS